MRRRHTHYIYIIVSSLCLFLSACDPIADADRLYDPMIADGGQKEEQPEEPSKTVRRIVLLEDFTGQRCTNCPKAADVIDLLHEAFGDRVVPVGIHGGPLAFAGNAKTLGLKTDIGDEYYSHWHLEYQPVGLVNRHEPLNYLDWTTTVKEELYKPATLRLGGSAVLADGAITIQVTVESAGGTVAGKLQVWLLEDGIKALQLMPDGTANQDYIHNHVFRASVNGTWGEDISVSEGETVQRIMTQPLATDWNPAQLDIVAFVYNDSGVQQVAKFQVKL